MRITPIFSVAAPPAGSLEEEITNALAAAYEAAQAGDLARAAQIYGMVLQHAPDNAKALVGMARVYLSADDTEQAAVFHGAIVPGAGTRVPVPLPGRAPAPTHDVPTHHDRRRKPFRSWGAGTSGRPRAIRHTMSDSATDERFGMVGANRPPVACCTRDGREARCQLAPSLQSATSWRQPLRPEPVTPSTICRWKIFLP